MLLNRFIARIVVLVVLGSIVTRVPYATEILTGVMVVVLVLAMLVALPVVVLLLMAPQLADASAILKNVLEIMDRWRGSDA